MAPVLRLRSVRPLLAQGVAGAEPARWWDVVRHDVIPVAAAYLLFLGVLVAYARARRRPMGPPRGNGRAQARSDPRTVGPGWHDLVRYTVAMAMGGYVFFLSIVVVFYFVLGGEDFDFIRQAFVEGSLLTFVLVVPAFLLFSLVEDLRPRRGRPQH